MLKLNPKSHHLRPPFQNLVGNGVDFAQLIEGKHVHPMSRLRQCGCQHSNSQVLLAVRSNQCNAHGTTSRSHILAKRVPAHTRPETPAIATLTVPTMCQKSVWACRIRQSAMQCRKAQSDGCTGLQGCPGLYVLPVDSAVAAVRASIVADAKKARN